MPVLGAKTQHFRSYGKRRTNVVSRRQPLGGWGDSPPARRDSSSSSDSGESGSSSSEDESEALRKAQAAAAARKERLAETRKTTSTATAKVARPSLAAKRAQAVEGEENFLSPSRPGKKAAAAAVGQKREKKKAVASSSSSSSSEDEAPAVVRAPLAPKCGTAGKARTYMEKQAGGRWQESEEEEQERVLLPKRSLQGGGRRRAPVVVSSDDEAEGEKEAEAVEPEPVPQLADEDPSASSFEDDNDDEPLPFSLPGLSSGSARVSLAPATIVPAPVRAATPPRLKRSFNATSGRRSSPLSSPPITPASRHSSSSSSGRLSHGFRQSSEHSSCFSPRPSPSVSSLPLPPSIAPLLPHLLHPAPLSFSDFISTAPAPLAYFSDPDARPEWRKIGEASYSEVFETMGEWGEEVVVKIIPISSGEVQDDEEELPFASEPDAVRREIKVSQLLGGGEDGEGVEGFVRFKGAFLVQGSYPDQLLQSWDEYKAAQDPPCEDQIRPDVLPSNQLYALILLSNAGSDLETYKLRSWREAASVLYQVVETLGRAEEEFGFEHRDLHWGNILLSSVAPTTPHPSITPQLHRRVSALSLSHGGAARTSQPEPKLDLSAQASGVRATLIDFTLSRLEKEGETLFDAFEDECVFEGEGDHQFDVYREMRTLIELEGGGWEGSHTKTNVLWLHYLTLKLLHSKKLKPPPSLPSSSTAFSAAPSSPMRAAPSPLRRSRRTSLFPSSSMASPARRTAATNSILRLSAFEKRELEQEKRMYELLKRAEEGLGKAVERWGVSSPVAKRGRGRKPAPAKNGRRKTVSQPAEVGEEDFASAAAFGRWWLGAV
ncbi:hypothetical protein JCM10213_004359 [Rhodosporidiobolus nylandii]